jgi:phage terminase small subunit
MTDKEARPPRHLSAQARKFWQDAMSTWVLDDPAALTLLRLACEAMTRGEEAKKLLDAEGLTVRDRYQQTRPHPACGVEQQCRLAVARLLRELRLLEPPADDEVRIPRIGRAS